MCDEADTEARQPNDALRRPLGWRPLRGLAVAFAFAALVGAALSLRWVYYNWPTHSQKAGHLALVCVAMAVFTLLADELCGW